MRFTVCWLGLLAFVTGSAAELQVSVQDNRGRNLEGAAVIATTEASVTAKSDGGTAIMDQVDKRFEPEVLIVRTGTAVSFPNSDSVAHQVYSFSPAKRFALPLYRGQAHAPIVFDHPGVVVLGCNIHDQMVGYIYVTTSPYFGKTDAHGNTALTLPSGNYRVTVWHPRLDESVTDREIKMTGSVASKVTVRLQKPLRPSRSSNDNKIRDY